MDVDHVVRIFVCIAFVRFKTIEYFLLMCHFFSRIILVHDLFFRGSYWGAATGSAYTWTNITALAIGIWALADKESVDSIYMVSSFFLHRIKH